MRQKHWTIKYRSQSPTFILRWSIKSYWLIIPRYYVYTSNSLQDIRQNHWTMKYRSQWPTFILRSRMKSYWLITPKYHVYTSNSLQNIRQNPWTMKYRSEWPTLISTLFSVCDLDLMLAAEWCQLFWNHTEPTLIKHQGFQKYKQKKKTSHKTLAQNVNICMGWHRHWWMNAEQ